MSLGCHFYWGSAAALDSDRDARLTLKKLWKSWHVPSQDLIARDSKFYKPLLQELEKVWVERGIRARGFLSTKTQRDAFLRGTFWGSLTDALRFSCSARDAEGFWNAFKEAHPRAHLQFLLQLGLPMVDTQNFGKSKSTIKLPFSIHGKSTKIACPVRVPSNNFDPARAPTFDAPMNSDLFLEGQQVLREWLDVNSYPCG